MRFIMKALRMEGFFCLGSIAALMTHFKNYSKPFGKSTFPINFEIQSTFK